MVVMIRKLVVEFAKKAPPLTHDAHRAAGSVILEALSLLAYSRNKILATPVDDPPGDDVVDDSGEDDDDDGGGGDGDSCGDTGNSSLCVEPGVEGVTHLVGEPWTPSQFSCARSCFITLVFFLQFVNNTYIQKMIMF